MSKQITVTWSESISYQQTFTVDDDFDPEAVDGDDEFTEGGSALLNLICEEGDITGARCDWLNVDEREVASYKVEGSEQVTKW